jgi:hypothetical protein
MAAGKETNINGYEVVNSRIGGALNHSSEDYSRLPKDPRPVLALIVLHVISGKYSTYVDTAHFGYTAVYGQSSRIRIMLSLEFE